MTTEQQDKPKRQYRYWAAYEDLALNKRYRQGIAINQLAIEFDRSPAAIKGRLVLHGEFSPLKTKKS